MKITVPLLVLCCCFTLVGCKKKDDSSPVAGPTIIGFTPQSGTAGTVVVISGNGFSSTLAENTVKFNSALAVVSEASATQITATVPSAASTGKITVTVGNQTASS